MEVSFATPKGKKVKEMLGNVHEKNFKEWLEESGETYDAALEIFMLSQKEKNK